MKIGIKSNNIKLLGFTLIELMIVVAIIGVLSMIAIPKFMTFLSKSKRAEAYINLSSLAMAQKTYWAEHNRYTTRLTGPDSLGWKPQGDYNYTYGFGGGSEGSEYYTGKLKAPSSALSGAYADENSFKVYAAADIDGDGEYDILSIDQDSHIEIIQDDLQ